MKINLASLARNAAEAIDPKRDRGAYAFVLEELAGHVEMVRSGKATLAQFAALYMIEPKVPA